ncbi:MAG: hypothetical protein K8R76_13175 [Candidatus Aegiribacteria sp.]|nr:hypothetical protein [Candidatus Aegiribacteria sp.]
MKQNLKLITRLVRKAKKELDHNDRREALELMKKAVSIDDNNGLVVQVIQALDRKDTSMTILDEPLEDQVFDESFENPVFDEPLENPVFDEPLENPVFDKSFENPVFDEPLENPVFDEPLEEPVPDEPDEWPQAFIEPVERKLSMPIGDQLIKLNQLVKLFEASDKAFDEGHQAKAIAYLNKARKMDPDNPDIETKLDSLKSRMKAANLISIARKKLAAGNMSESILFAQQAFEMMPDINGLQELLEDLENADSKVASPMTNTNDGDKRTGSNKPYIAKIRQLVQDNSLEEAASIALRSFRDNQDDELLMQFIENFRKLGLIEG